MSKELAEKFYAFFASFVDHNAKDMNENMPLFNELPEVKRCGYKFATKKLLKEYEASRNCKGACQCKE